MSIVFLATGCSYITGGTDNSEPPMPLAKIKPEKKFVKLWSEKVGGGDYSEYLKLKPLALDSQIVTIDGRGTVQARNSLTGKLIWKNNLNKKVNSGVSGNSEKLFIGFADGNIAALDATSGKLLWQHPLDKNILSSSFYDSKNVYVQTTDGTLSSLDGLTGKLNWEYKVLVPDLTLYATSSPIVWGNMVIAGFSNGKIMAFNKATGNPEWDYQIATPNGRSNIQRMVDINASPVVNGGVLYAVSYQGNMVAVDLNNGAELWKFSLSSINDFTVNYKHIYVSDTEGTVWALNRDNGRVLWQQNNLHMRELSGTNFLEDTIVVGDYAGYFHGLANNHGGIIARGKLGGSGIRVAPLVKNDIMYILDNSGRLAAYKLESMRKA
ncbi:MAG: outer membrane protein assembly factor BamB [Gammaproteobacteria bacterium]|nr:outer membrane protein assembly factor BamB [Gammaproteobacteria bacterium]